MGKEIGFDNDLYHSSTATRAITGKADFAYSAEADYTHKVHQALDPARILLKAYPKLESRDSIEHPNSNAVILGIDVTGSNIGNAKIAQKKLPELMNALVASLPDPQVAIWANDDYVTSGKACIQLSEFESGNLIDDWIRSTWLVGQGGGNQGESYDLLLFAAARLTELDCLEKRGRKGYMILYADEPIMTFVSA